MQHAYTPYEMRKYRYHEKYFQQVCLYVIKGNETTQQTTTQQQLFDRDHLTNHYSTRRQCNKNDNSIKTTIHQHFKLDK